MDNPDKISRVMAMVEKELRRATKIHGSFRSQHEGYAVILEELDEMWDEVKTNNQERAVCEAVQVAAMGCRFILDNTDD